MNSQNEKPKKKIYKRWWFWLIILFGIITYAVNTSSKTESNGEHAKVAQSGSNKAKDNSSKNTENADNKVSQQTKESKPSVPVEYSSALTKAKSYSSLMHMSKKRIFDQLTSEYGEKFSEEAANYAVDNLNADYNENALKKAKSYQDHMSMSPDAIRDQLTSDYGEKFTPEEANYAIEHLAK
ncbi:Ltp family lipoprotein [Companilactobacillus sp.]|uniref:Ltp family lipoprotein n=1 Tax=Companilactobacillus sp. TaxID=2767905 RepID=UPI0025B88766|nr:Ltp family lipoprotein [Companilactobacillus sp.]MCH4009735.1 Ltp family lipoprotein [Companilactobacillus sp.]MCH4052589.1 Ltp family lipoprotein [Companilactobacillus sp.]MCH4077677.1 Ltp family lipoprotein [Companilactobacillus sp.]MCH4126253.1 Ltp family lipoprotein [Companilactobacillus sp.]MCI1311961.1 Ltp family lipoprotein [Companilactobacillus sp.]